MRRQRLISAVKTVLRKVDSGNESGQALVETALTVPLLLIMLLGAFELGQVAYAAIEVTNAAKAGLQYAAMNGGGFTDPSGLSEAARFDAFNMTGGTGTNLTASASLSCTCSSSTDTVATCSTTQGVTGCTSSHILATVTVNTQLTFTPVVRLSSMGSSFTLHGTASQRVLQ